MLISVPVQCGCGGPYPIQFHYNRIFSGFPATNHSLPFQASVVTSVPGVCGASLISMDYVLTAAQCVYNVTVLSVILGDHDRLSPDGERIYGVSQVIIHPQYNPTNKAYDMAILKLNTSVPTLTPNVQIVCLPPNDTLSYVGRSMVISGWGKSNTNSYPTELLANFVTGVNIDDCAQSLKQDLTAFGTSLMCATGNSTAASICLGDFGGDHLTNDETS